MLGGSSDNVCKVGNKLNHDVIKQFECDDYHFHWEILANSILPESKHLVRLRDINHDRFTARMDLYDTNLKSYITDPKLYEQRNTIDGIAQRKSIITDIFKGLHDIHSAGLVHNNLSHSNILLRTESGKLTAAICDFGASILSDTSYGGTTLNVSSNDKIKTPAHDYYAVGMIIYSMWNPQVMGIDRYTPDGISKIPVDLQQLTLNLLDDNTSTRRISVLKFTGKEIKSRTNVKFKGTDSKHLKYIRSIVDTYAGWDLDEKSQRAIIKMQCYLGNKLSFVIAFLYLSMMIVGIDFCYESELLELGFTERSQRSQRSQRNKCDGYDKITNQIKTILEDRIDLIRLFIEYRN